MNPETVEKMTGPQYMDFVSKIISTHTAVVFQMKQILNNRKEELNELFKAIHENPLIKESIVGQYGGTNISIGPFLGLFYDEDQKNTYLEYATPEELHNIFYEGVDQALSRQWYAEKFGLSEGATNRIKTAEMIGYMTPIVGTGMDARDLVRHISRGNWREARYSGIFLTTGLAFDGLLVASWAAAPFTFGASGAGGTAASIAGRTAVRGIGRGVARGAARAGTATARTLSQMGRTGASIKRTFASINRPLERIAKSGIGRYPGLLAMGGSISTGLIRLKGTVASGKFYAGEEIKYETVNNGDLPPINFEKFDMEELYVDGFEFSEQTYRTEIERLKSETNWQRLQYEFLGDERIRISRTDCEESVVIKRNFDDITEDVIWEIEGLEMGYLDLYQAIAVANLLNNVSDLVETEGSLGENENPFQFARAGHLEYEGEISDEDEAVILGASDAWTIFYQNQLGLDTKRIKEILNRWYQVRARASG